MQKLSLQRSAPEVRHWEERPHVIFLWHALALTLLLWGAVLSSAFSCDRDAAGRQRVTADLARFLRASAAFEAEHGRWPASLAELAIPPPIDPWTGEPLLPINHPGERWDLVSYGADQAPGGSEWDTDIRSDARSMSRTLDREEGKRR